MAWRPLRAEIACGAIAAFLCERLPRSQWRVRAGFSPASLSTDLVGAHAIPEPGMTVNLTRIYTRLGDGGETHLGDMSRVPKTHPRIEAYGTVDELNAQLGAALAQGALPERFVPWLQRVQNDLFDVGADISVPHGGDRERLRLAPEQTAWLEQACDEVNAELPNLKSFVLPGGTVAAAQLHVCRTVCRRAERRTIACGDEVNGECVRYLNRLSDLLFILSRAANVATGNEEPLWEPGRYR
jgi:cob(I)alamin adenosyltransferase